MGTSPARSRAGQTKPYATCSRGIFPSWPTCPKQELTSPGSGPTHCLASYPEPTPERPLVCGHLFEYSQQSPRQRSFHYPPPMDAIVLWQSQPRVAWANPRGDKSRGVQARIGQPSGLASRRTISYSLSSSGGGRNRPEFTFLVAVPQVRLERNGLRVFATIVDVNTVAYFSP